MKKFNFQTLAFILLSFQISFAQENLLKVGDKAPKINITNYIAHPPKDKNLNSRPLKSPFRKN